MLPNLNGALVLYATAGVLFRNTRHWLRCSPELHLYTFYRHPLLFCFVISTVYKECYKNANVYDGLVRVDNKIKHHIINVFAKEFTDMSTNIARAELKTLR